MQFDEGTNVDGEILSGPFSAVCQCVVQSERKLINKNIRVVCCIVHNSTRSVCSCIPISEIKRQSFAGEADRRDGGYGENQGGGAELQRLSDRDVHRTALEAKKRFSSQL